MRDGSCDGVYRKGGRADGNEVETRPQEKTPRSQKKDWVIIGTGPSLTRADCDVAAQSGATIIAVNDAWRLCPSAHFLYACDLKWWRVHIDAVRASGFAGQKVSQYTFNDGNDELYLQLTDLGVWPMPGAHNAGLGYERIHYNSNSGAQAINLAWLLAGGELEHVALLGLDMSWDKAQGNKKHFFGDHPTGLHDGNHASFIPRFDLLAADLAAMGVEVTNCSRRTELTQFPRGTIEQWCGQ